MYSVISKPKRKSVKAGVDQVMLYLLWFNSGISGDIHVGMKAAPLSMTTMNHHDISMGHVDTVNGTDPPDRSRGAVASTQQPVQS